MKRVADRKKTIVRIPPILQPIQVQVPLRGIAPEFRDVTIAVRIPPDRTNVQNTVYVTIL